MGVITISGRTLRAGLCEIERGLFYATYSGSASDTDDLAIYQTCASAADAKEQIEAKARALGYDTVIWTQTAMAPLFASSDRTTLHKRVLPYAVRLGA